MTSELLDSIIKLGVEGVAICGLLYILNIQIRNSRETEIRNSRMSEKHIEAFQAILDKIKSHHNWSVKNNRKCKIPLTKKI